MYHHILSNRKNITFGVFCLVLAILSCNPQGLINQPKKYYIRPPVLFMTTIVSFRETNGIWPRSMNEIMVVSEQNRKVVNSFPYDKTSFHIKKRGMLVVRFSGYKKDPQFISRQSNHQLDQRIVDGRIRFYKSKDKFTWEVYYY